MEQFDAQIKKDGSDRLTIMEIPFDAKAVFRKPKGTIYVSGTTQKILRKFPPHLNHTCPRPFSPARLNACPAPCTW